MIRNYSNILLLTGGLGNQLFQLSFGLAVTRGDLLLELKLGNPRCNTEGLPDLLDFTLPEGVASLNSKSSKFMSRLVGYNLRIGVVPRGIEKKRIFAILINIISSLLISIHYKRWLTLYVSKGVGHSSQDIAEVKNKLIIGYFQNSAWLNQDNVRNSMTSITIRDPSSEYLRLLDKIKTEPTTIIHMRLGDYLQEPNFGIPNVNYVETALRLIHKTTEVNTVWGFSDEPEKAMQLLENVTVNEIFWVPTILLNTAETFGLMREGNGYVIANSTFSWWAAALRHNQAAQVVCPEPWFAAMEEPAELVPSEWLRIEAY